MKHILIIDDRRLPWDQIALELQETNARISIFTIEESRKVLESPGINLVILAEESHRLLALPDAEVVRLILSEAIPPGEIIRAREGRSAIRLGWPVSRKDLNELTSRVLSVPERRSLQIPVLIGLRKGGASLRGNSKDFSLGGMAFTTRGELEPSEEITVSFGGRGERRGLKLGARVVRRHPLEEQGTSFYGARFGNLSKEERHALEQFVWRIPRKGP